ncbi:MAG: DNA methyltransferase, partial [Terriglobia bacterium]
MARRFLPVKWSLAKLGHIANGDANKLSPLDRAAHDWYRFVLSFPPHLVREYLRRFGIGPRRLVLDPFCGTGTTIVECMKLGIPSIGVEANPMAHFATQVKSDWSPDPEGLLRHARKVAKLAGAELESDGIPDDSTLPLFSSVRKPDSARDRPLRRLPPEMQKLLLRNSISPLPLHKTLVLLEVLEKYEDLRYRSHELLALAKILVYSVSNLHFGPEVGVGPAKRDSPVLSEWLRAIQTMAADLRILPAAKGASVHLYRSDSRRIAEVVDCPPIDAVITSPPYPNEKDYTRTTRLESVLLGFVRSRADLRALKSGLV